MNSEIIWTECSKTEIGNLNREKAEHYYPMGLIDGKIEVHFLHYDSCIEAWKKWKRRAKRIDYEHAFFIGMDQNGCTEADIKAFDALPFRKKVFFLLSLLKEILLYLYLNSKHRVMWVILIKRLTFLSLLIKMVKRT